MTTAISVGQPAARACLLTPPGRGAVAVVRVWGAGALEAADRAFRPRRGAGLARSPRGRPRLGRVGVGLGDEVVALATPDNPTEVEIQCHGGLAAVELVFDALRAEGLALADSTEWARHTAPSPLTADAMQELARTTTVRTAELLLAQAEGALDRELTEILATIRDRRQEALAQLDRLLHWASVGTRLTTGWRVALAGRPNVGKSCLLNALAGFERAIVSPLPGTTRDVVTVRTAFAGWPVELADTAGLRDTADAIEAEGIDRARSSQAEADLVLILLDRSEPLADRDLALIERHPRSLLVATKADLPAAWKVQDQMTTTVVSARTGDGLDVLMERVADRLVPEPPGHGVAMPFLPRQVGYLIRARARLARGDVGATELILRRLREGRGQRSNAGC